MVLVTGATGCLGSNLVRRLVAEGERVAILRFRDDQAPALGSLTREVEHRVGDVRDRDAVRRALRGVTYLYHVAGVATAVNAHAREMRSVNVDGTATVMEEAKRAGLARVVHTSSAIAIGLPNGEDPVDETFKFNGEQFNHAYATTKRMAEDIVRRVAGAGLDAVILNPSAVMAPGGSQRQGWASLVAALRAGWLRVYPGGGVSMSSGVDVADAHIRAMARGRSGERYIVAGHHLSYAELFRMIARVLDVRAPRVRVPNSVLAVGGWAGSAFGRLRSADHAPFLTRENVPLMTRTMFYDQAKAERELGVGTTPLEPAVAQVDRWCRERGDDA
jgi:dihydroflavonol-4-reductase